MNFNQAITDRHSVRQYIDKPISDDLKAQLSSYVAEQNKESGLHIQVIFDEPQAFNCFMADYGSFKNVTNYIALVGKNDDKLSEKCGYYGEKIVLFAQTLGLNTCWVGMSYSKSKAQFTVSKGEKLCLMIALGYGENQGKPHKSKSYEEVVKSTISTPDWFKKGITAALLAPTAINQQKFTFFYDGEYVWAKAGLGFFSKVDLGIVKAHFEIGAGRENVVWKA